MTVRLLCSWRKPAAFFLLEKAAGILQNCNSFAIKGRVVVENISLVGYSSKCYSCPGRGQGTVAIHSISKYPTDEAQKEGHPWKF
jgi:hypothetical protein